MMFLDCFITLENFKRMWKENALATAGGNKEIKAWDPFINIGSCFLDTEKKNQKARS